MKHLLPAFVLTCFFFSVGQVHAQNVYKDYVKDKYSRYSPNDHVCRGLIYRTQTGHAGFFSDCDDDIDKLYSPYIKWSCRPNRAWNPVADFLKDQERRSRRLINGAGDCVTGNCNQECNGPDGCRHCQGTQAGDYLFPQQAVDTSKAIVGVARRKEENGQETARQKIEKKSDSTRRSTR